MKTKNLEKYYHFISDIVDICKKYGLSMSYDSGSDSLLIEDYKDANIEWLKECQVSPTVVESMFKEQEY